jgi:Transposase, Mutator family
MTKSLKRGYKYHCNTCSNKLQKRGLTAAGSQRWFCAVCSKSGIKLRQDLSQAFLLERFHSWLLGKLSVAELGSKMTERTWRTQVDWCWQIRPIIEVTGEVYPVLLVDGIRIGSMVCLIARTVTHIVAWEWVPWESSAMWSKLFDRLPAPNVIVCDGQKGLLLAIQRSWPSTLVQRCIVHVVRNSVTKLTRHPQTEAGASLLQLGYDLYGITSLELSSSWQARLITWGQAYDGFISQKTYYVKPNGSKGYWYTHKRVRSAYKQLTKLVQDNQLFVCLDKSNYPGRIPNTTNFVEGGINSQLRTKLKYHRGMQDEHQRRLVEWYLYSRSEDPKPPRNFL